MMGMTVLVGNLTVVAFLALRLWRRRTNELPAKIKSLT
jgi:uncharacterized membrane protein